MPKHLTNLLPEYFRTQLVHEYYLRLSVIALFMVAGVFVAAAVLLAPSYVFLIQSEKIKEERLASMTSTLSSSDEIAFSARLVKLSNEADILTQLSRSRSVSETIRTILDVPRAGIKLSGMTYAPVIQKQSRKVSVSGVAATREALRMYQLALQGAPTVLAAELPVSAYASDANISFTITLTLDP